MIRFCDILPNNLIVVIAGDFGFEKTTVGLDTKILVGAANVTVFLGANFGTDDELGVRLSNGELGLVLFQTGTGASTYALTASGTAALVGIDAITDWYARSKGQHNRCCSR